MKKPVVVFVILLAALLGSYFIYSGVTGKDYKTLLHGLVPEDTPESLTPAENTVLPLEEKKEAEFLREEKDMPLAEIPPQIPAAVADSEDPSADYYIQAGAWKNEKYAQNMLEKMQDAYPDAYVAEHNGFSKLRIPGIAGRSAGRSVIKDIKERYGMSSLLVKKTDAVPAEPTAPVAIPEAVVAETETAEVEEVPVAAEPVMPSEPPVVEVAEVEPVEVDETPVDADTVSPAAVPEAAAVEAEPGEVEEVPVAAEPVMPSEPAEMEVAEVEPVEVDETPADAHTVPPAEVPEAEAAEPEAVEVEEVPVAAVPAEPEVAAVAEPVEVEVAEVEPVEAEVAEIEHVEVEEVTAAAEPVETLEQPEAAVAERELVAVEEAPVIAESDTAAVEKMTDDRGAEDSGPQTDSIDLPELPAVGIAAVPLVAEPVVPAAPVLPSGVDLFPDGAGVAPEQKSMPDIAGIIPPDEPDAEPDVETVFEEDYSLLDAYKNISVSDEELQGRIAVFPLENLTDSREAGSRVTAVLNRRLEEKGFTVVDDSVTGAYLCRERVRTTGYVSRSLAGEIREKFRVSAVLLGALIAFSEGENPHVGLLTRIIDTADGRILWAGYAAATGEDFVTLLGLGKIETAERLIPKVVDSMFSSLNKEELMKKKGDLQNIAVVPFRNNSGFKNAGVIAMHLFIMELFKSGEFQPVEYGNIRDSIIRLKIRDRGELTYEAIAGLSDAVAAQGIVVGVVDSYSPGLNVSVPARVGITARLVSGSSKKIVWYNSGLLTGEDDIIALDWGRVRSVHTVAYYTVSEMVRKMGTSKWH